MYDQKEGKDNDLILHNDETRSDGGKASADEKNPVYQIQDADCVMIVMAARRIIRMIIRHIGIMGR